MLDSFRYAFRGIKDAIRSEANLSIHLLFGSIALIFAYFFKFTNLEFAILVLTVFLIIILELVNTVIEKLVDMHSKEISEEARIIKDISAGVVLLGAVASTIVGLFLFLPRIF